MEKNNVKADVEKLLKEGHSIQIPPTGWSMYPLIIPGRDAAIVSPVSPTAVRRGDVVLYRRDGTVADGATHETQSSNAATNDAATDNTATHTTPTSNASTHVSSTFAPGILVLHRVWKVAPEGFYMVGDNQKEIEGPLRPDQIRGKMTAVVRKGRNISVGNIFYRLLTGLWLRLRPLRPLLSHTAAAVKRIFRKK